MQDILANSVLDALAAQVAVLDGDGTIVAVNEAWKRFGRANGCSDENCYVGWNYLSVLEAARNDPTCPSAEPVLAGINHVMRGGTDDFEVEYPCHSPAGLRWFVMNVTRAVGNAGARFVVAHSDITARKQSELALERTERLLRTVLETLPVGVWIMDAAGRIVEGNPAGRQIWAGARYVGPEKFGEYKGWWLDSGKPIEPDQWAAARAIRNGEVSIDEEIEIECFDGTRKIILNSAMPLRDGEGRISGAIIVNQDITARKRGEAALQETSSRLQTLFDILPVGVSIVNANRQIIQMNGALERLLRLNSGTYAEQVRERSYIHRDGSPFSPSDFPSGRARDEHRAVEADEIGVRLEDGETIWVNVSAAPLPDSSDVVIVTADITERIRTEEELVRAKESIESANQELKLAYAREHLLARTDSLTGVRNRRHFYDIASHEFTVARRYAQDVSVILLDIDFFKRVNDTYGHEKGDIVLRKVAELASAEVREADLLARFGGEEFIVLLPNTPASIAATVAERMREKIETYDWARGPGIEGLTISAGVADSEQRPQTLDELIRRADRALYSAKSSGRNRIAVFDPVGV